MSFMAVLLALLIEQFKPLPRDNWAHRVLETWVGWTGRNLDAGQPFHAWVVLGVTVLAPTVLAGLIYAAVGHFTLVGALLLDVVTLYLTLGFRQFSHFYTDIRDALDRGDEDEARRLLAEWRHLDTSELPRSEVLRHVIEHALLAAHRHVFGVFFWFVLFSALGLGPAGAVLYRMAEFSARYWSYRHRTLQAPAHRRLAECAVAAMDLIDRWPSRLTASGFAVVGNFEEAIACWRRDAHLWAHQNEGVILASAAGALSLQLGGAAAPGVTPDRSKTFASGVDSSSTSAQGSTPGQEVQRGHLHSVVGLVWRSVVLWMLLLLMMTLANVLG